MRSIRLQRVALVLGSALLVAIVAFGSLILAFLLNFHHFAPKASYPVPRSALEAQRQDLDYFARVMALDRAFSPAARAAAQERIQALSVAEALPPAKLQVALMQVMASADNGHSRMDPTAERGTLVLPLRVTSFAGGFYVMRATAPYRDMLGGRVESIDGQAFGQIVARLETLRGGVEGLRRENAAVFIVVQDLLYGLGIAADPRSSTWTVLLPDGRVVTHRLAAHPLNAGEELASGERWLFADAASGSEEGGWITYRPSSGEVPETWRDYGDHFRLFSAAGSCAQVVRVQSIADTVGQKIAPFLDSAERALRARPPCAVIVDLRGNGGGDYTKAWHFAHALPGMLLPGGRIFVLTDSLTFSAAITTAAFIKDAGGDRVTIIGQPIGDRLAFFSEGGRACLPNLKVCMYYQTGKHDYAHACNDWRECYWLNWFYPVRVRSLQPDIVVPLRFEDWNAGRDAAYLAALEAPTSHH